MKNHLHFKIVFLIYAVALFINIGSFGVVESSDARYAEIAREMFVSGDLTHPNLLDVHHYHKPPLTYQITALGYKLFGVNPFGARFFLQIAILLQLVLVYLLTKLLFKNNQTALWAMIIYLSYPIVLVSSRNLTTDAFLATFALWSIYSWVKYRKSGIIFYLYSFTVCLGLGFLTKGPVIFIVPVVFILFFNRIEKSKISFNIHHVLAWLLFLGIATSWFVYLSIQNTNFINYFLGRQTADRFSKNVFGRTEPFWYFMAFGPLVALPWFILTLYLIKDQIKLFSRKSLYNALLIGCLVPLIFFSISSSKRILYILPVFSLMAVLTAQLFSKISIEKSKIVYKILIGFLLVLVLAFSATLFINIEFIVPKSLGIISIFMIPFIFLIYKTKRINSKLKSMHLTVAISILLLIGSGVVLSTNQLKVNSPKPVTDFILGKKLNDRKIIVYNTMKPSIAFGLNKSIISLNDGNSDLAREIQFEKDLNWKKYLIDMNNETELQYLKQILSEPTVLLLYKKPLPQNLEWMLSYYKNIKIMEKWAIYY
ncbi:MAG: glycosyltransferase family 39 protein [Bacteroidales bacterium]|jgi:4-amino-4-deoxy-L-arabinose transferase-like glycosyltransferase|nr:glycosyltransferase family 39 protein [Bacteroidales bacterium]